MLNRALLLLAAFFLIAVPVFAADPPACTHGTDVTPISADHDTLAAYIAGTAVDGDVICLAAGGPYTYESQIDITNGATIVVELRGAGTMPTVGSAAQTIIYSHAGAVFGGYEVPGSMHHPTIDNIKFTVDENSEAAAIVIGNSSAAGIGKSYIIHHNDFAVTGTCNHHMITLATNHGVIYRNKFTSEAIAACSYGFTNLLGVLANWTYSDTQAKWETASTFGSADTTGDNNIYLETNYFSGFLGSDFTAASRGVIRFNDTHNTDFTVHGYDSNPVGVRQVEFYNNHLNCDESGQGHAVNMSEYLADRGGTGFIFGNTFEAYNATYCSNSGSTLTPPINLPYFRDVQCQEIGGWPGAYNGGTGSTAYPPSHLPGWGWISGLNVTVGVDQGLPAAGFLQALEPFYLFHNTNNTGNAYPEVARGAPACRAMAYSNTGKTSGTTLRIPASGETAATPYYNVGQEAVVVFADLVGGTAPTIADSLGNSWTLIQGGTNSGMRVTAWHSRITTGGAAVITVTFDSSAAARAGTVVVMRGISVTAINQNPSVITDNTSPYQGTATGSLDQTNEMVLGYYALNGPIDDAPFATAAPDATTTSCDPCGAKNTGINGTTGSTASTNVMVAVVQHLVTDGSTTQTSLTDANNRNGIAGTIAFRIASNDVTNLDLLASDLIQANREYYAENGSFDGSSGTGYGVRASRPATCTTGVAYWSTDQGSWNTSGSGGNGVLDKCTGTNTWTNAWYVPYDYPNPLADVTGGGGCTPDHLAFIGQPSNAVLGAVLGTVSVGIYDSGDVLCTAETSTIIITNSGGTCTGMTLGGTSTGDAVAGVFTTTNLTESVATGACTIKGSFGALTDGTSSSFTISAAVQGTGGGIGSRIKLNVR